MDIETAMARIWVIKCPTRLNVWEAVGPEGMYPSDIASTLRLAPSTVTHHLNILREAGLVTVTYQGRYRLYRCTGEKWAVISEAELEDYVASVIPTQSVESIHDIVQQPGDTGNINGA